jgi:predicted DNA-binding transcriptional regulator
VTRWQYRISRPDAPAVPIWVRRWHRTFWVPPKDIAIMGILLSGRFHWRDLAARVGVPVWTVRSRVRALWKMGIVLRLTTHRGRSGWVSAQVNPDATTVNPYARVANVRTVETGIQSKKNDGTHIQPERVGATLFSSLRALMPFLDAPSRA